MFGYRYYVPCLKRMQGEAHTTDGAAPTVYEWGGGRGTLHYWVQLYGAVQCILRMCDLKTLTY